MVRWLKELQKNTFFLVKHLDCFFFLFRFKLNSIWFSWFPTVDYTSKYTGENQQKSSEQTESCGAAEEDQKIGL